MAVRRVQRGSTARNGCATGLCLGEVLKHLDLAPTDDDLKRRPPLSFRQVRVLAEVLRAIEQVSGFGRFDLGVRG